MPAAEPVTVLIADDSPLACRVLRRIFDGDPGFRVVGEATNGRDAVRLATTLRPRLVTLDVVMPGLNGLEAVELIMAEAPTRILVITAEASAALSFEALSRGALELIPKPTAWPELSGGAELLALARRLAAVPVLPHVRGRQRGRERRLASEPVVQGRPEILVIGASTGGPRALGAVLGAMPADFPLPVVVVQHLADSFAEGFVRWLGGQCPLRVREASQGALLAPGEVVVGVRAPHVALQSRGVLGSGGSTLRAGHCPSVDVLFESAARVYGGRAAGVLLSGMGSDGAAGLRSLALAGALTIAQDEATSAVFGMPRAAIELGAARLVLGRDEIAPALERAAAGELLVLSGAQ